MMEALRLCDAIRQIGVSEVSYYRWRKKYGGMGALVLLAPLAARELRRSPRSGRLSSGFMISAVERCDQN